MKYKVGDKVYYVYVEDKLFKYFYIRTGIGTIKEIGDGYVNIEDLKKEYEFLNKVSVEYIAKDREHFKRICKDIYELYIERLHVIKNTLTATLGNRTNEQYFQNTYNHGLIGGNIVPGGVSDYVNDIEYLLFIRGEQDYYLT